MIITVTLPVLILFGVCDAADVDPFEHERILSGTVASLEEFPYMINMFYNGAFRCGGSILSQKTILTAAHCTYGTTAKGLTINAGSLNLGEGATHAVSQIVQHADYNSSIVANDVSLLILEKPLTFSNVIKAVEYDQTFIGGDVNAISSGWGMTSYPGASSTVLMYLPMTTVEHKKCQNLMLPLSIQSSQLCAFSGSQGKGVCRGDSGGPLTVDNKVVGIASWVKEYCAKGAPDVFTRVSMFADWIKKTQAIKKSDKNSSNLCLSNIL